MALREKPPVFIDKIVAYKAHFFAGNRLHRIDHAVRQGVGHEKPFAIRDTCFNGRDAIDELGLGHAAARIEGADAHAGDFPKKR